MLLKRDISVLTQRFKTAWDKYTKQRAESRKKPIGDDVTPEQFRDALAVFGIENAAKLAEVMGCGKRQAGTVWGNPQKLTAERQRKLMTRAESDIDAQIELVSQLNDAMDWLSYACAVCPDDDPKYPEYLDEYGKTARALDNEEAELDRLFKARGILSRNRYRADAERAARLEFQARALLEGFNALTDGDRRLILRSIDGMLSRYRGDEARAIRRVLGDTRFGHKVRLHDLADLVAGGDEADYLEGTDPDTFEYEVLNEYAGGKK